MNTATNENLSSFPSTRIGAAKLKVLTNGDTTYVFDCARAAILSAMEQKIPDWVDDDLVAQTIRVWEPYYDRPLAKADAAELLRTISQLVDALLNA